MVHVLCTHTHMCTRTCPHVCHSSSFSHHSFLLRNLQTHTHTHSGYYPIIGQCVSGGLWVLNDCQICHRAERFIYSLNLLVNCQGRTLQPDRRAAKTGKIYILGRNCCTRLLVVIYVLSWFVIELHKSWNMHIIFSFPVSAMLMSWHH